jgi:cytidine deaminase
MKEEKFQFNYTVYDDLAELDAADADLLKKAREITSQAYAPYSNFFVGAVAITTDGDIVSGTNQENASFPVGICAERSLLASAASLFPGKAILTIAISYSNKNSGATSDRPISPCGMCRQALQEYETRGKRPMRLILGGQSGKIFIVNSTTNLLPFAFTSGELL